MLLDSVFNIDVSIDRKRDIEEDDEVLLFVNKNTETSIEMKSKDTQIEK